MGSLTGRPESAWAELAEQAREPFNRRCWYEAGGYLYDVVDGEQGDDRAFRPNQLLSVSLPHPVLNEGRWQGVVEQVAEKLLTPVGLRSLSREHPRYKSKYVCDRRARDAAYHQGTVWAWLIGPFIDAWMKVSPDPSEARSLLEGFQRHLSEAGIGTISEMFDAEPPYHPRGWHRSGVECGGGVTGVAEDSRDVGLICLTIWQWHGAALGPWALDSARRSTRGPHRWAPDVHASWLRNRPRSWSTRPRRASGFMNHRSTPIMLHRVRDGTVTLWTGNGHEWTATRQSLTDARAGLPAERTWLDGVMVADSLPALIGLVHLGSWNSTHEGAARSAGSPRLPGVRSRSRAGCALKPGRVGGILSAAPFRSGGPLETPAPRAAARQGSPAGLPVRPADDHSLHAGSIQAITVGSLP